MRNFLLAKHLESLISINRAYYVRTFPVSMFYLTFVLLYLTKEWRTCILFGATSANSTQLLGQSDRP